MVKNDVFVCRHKKDRGEGKVPFFWYDLFIIYKNVDGFEEKIRIAVDINTILQVCDMTARQLSALTVDSPKKVAEFVFKGGE